jgi:hypothetical protein
MGHLSTPEIFRAPARAKKFGMTAVANGTSTGHAELACRAGTIVVTAIDCDLP